MNEKHLKFKEECRQEIDQMGRNQSLATSSRSWLEQANYAKYSYHFEWLGRPIIQYPQDIVAFQEIVWEVKPDLIIETGIAHGGSLILSASLLSMLDYCDAVESGKLLNPREPKRRILGIDIDIRTHNREAIEAHPMSSRIDMIQGSSVDAEIIQRVQDYANSYEKVLVCLDSNHTHDHVLAELNAYASLATKDSYCVVFDTVIEDMPADMFPDRPWGPGNNAKTAVHEFLKGNSDFEIDKSIDHKLMISVTPDGWLKRTR